MTRILHISDVHVQVDYRREPWLPLGWRRWAALVEMIGFQRARRYMDAEATLGLGIALAESGNLEGLVNYGFLSFVVKPLASLMLKVLLTINRVIGNYGWSIVVLTIVLNMFFFPLRWKSSVSMKRTASSGGLGGTGSGNTIARSAAAA